MKQLMVLSLVIFMAATESFAAGGGAYAVSLRAQVNLDANSATEELPVEMREIFEQDLSDAELELLFN